MQNFASWWCLWDGMGQNLHCSMLALIRISPSHVEPRRKHVSHRLNISGMDVGGGAREVRRSGNIGAGR